MAPAGPRTRAGGRQRRQCHAARTLGGAAPAASRGPGTPGPARAVDSPAAEERAAVDVLKVAHHGSAYQDPDLIRAAAPRLALISCGADNTTATPLPARWPHSGTGVPWC